MFCRNDFSYSWSGYFYVVVFLGFFYFVSFAPCRWWLNIAVKSDTNVVHVFVLLNSVGKFSTVSQILLMLTLACYFTLPSLH